MTSDSTRAQLSGSHSDDPLYYQALTLQELISSRLSQRMRAALVNLRGRQRPRP